MFYCEWCAVKNKWPFDFFMIASIGRCEDCGKTRECVDVPSSSLPKPDPTVTEKNMFR